MTNKNLAVLGIFAVSLLLGAGFWLWMTFVGGGGPKIREVTVSPETFRFAGGHATVRAEVTDDEGVERVTAVLLADGTQVMSVELVRMAGDADRPVYVGGLQVPANVRSDGEVVDYTLRLLAVDTEGQETHKNKDLKVKAPGVPPAPPD